MKEENQSNKKSFTELLQEQRNDKMVEQVNDLLYNIGAKYHSTYFSDKQLIAELFIILKKELSQIKYDLQKLNGTRGNKDFEK